MSDQLVAANLAAVIAELVALQPRLATADDLDEVSRFMLLDRKAYLEKRVTRLAARIDHLAAVEARRARRARLEVMSR